MTLQPLLASSVAIQIHALAATLALAVGAGQFLLPRGTRIHKLSGWAWVVLMTVAAVSSFFIHSMQVVGIWSPIHLLSIYTLVMLAVALVAARRHAIRTHPYTMILLFVLGLIVPGAFTLVPGRIMHAVLLGGG